MSDQEKQDGLSDTLVNVAIASNSYRTMDPWVRSTGLRSLGLRHRNLSLSRDPRPAEDFLVSSRLVRHDREVSISIEDYFTDESVAMLSFIGREARAGFSEVELAQGPDLQMSVGAAMANRRSSRTFTGDPLDAKMLASLVRAVAGVTAIATVHLLQGGEAKLRFRAVPSGGGLYPNDLWIAALNVDQVDRGIYKYRPRDHRLIQTGDHTDLLRLLRSIDVSDDLISLSRASALVIIVGNVWRSMRKYGNRGMRFMLWEAGAMSEHLNLAAVALGLGSVDFSAFYDDEVNEAMEFDGIHQAVLHMSILGTPG